MTTSPRVQLAALLAIVVLYGPEAAAAAQQEASRPKVGVILSDSPDESAPTTTKKKKSAVDPLDMQGFNVALLLGEVHGGATPDNLPEGARKALADVREFLPYKNYRLLDTQWIRCCAGANVTGTLRGLDEQQYAFHVGIHSVAGSQLSANFALTDVAAPFKSGSVTHDRFGQPVPVKSTISSNFSMEIGETVVIGTSSLKGDKALVVLLTAVPRAGTTSAKPNSGGIE